MDGRATVLQHWKRLCMHGAQREKRRLLNTFSCRSNSLRRKLECKMKARGANSFGNCGHVVKMVRSLPPSCIDPAVRFNRTSLLISKVCCLWSKFKR